MSRNEQEWRAVPNLAADHYVDNAIYTDAEIFAEEMEKIFARVWKFVGHESEVRELGDYRTTMVAGKPMVIVRGDDGKVRCFYNVCPHRGAEIVRKPSGNGKNFTCLFHHWTFDRQGECVSIPLPDGYEDAGVSKEGQGLREVRIEIKYGLMFVNLDNNAMPLDEFLGGALDFVEGPFGSEEMELFHFHRIEIDANWKHWMDTDREMYHGFLHVRNMNTSMMSEGYNDRKLAVYPGGHMAALPIEYAFGRWEHSLRESRDESLPTMPPNESRAINLFPDMLINIKATLARTDCVIPVSPTRTIVEYRGYGLKSDTPELRRLRVNDHNEHWGPFGSNLPEDALACVVQMRTIGNGALPYSIYARNERGGACFDDEPVRHYYRTWSHWMDRAAHDPFGRRKGLAAA